MDNRFTEDWALRNSRSYLAFKLGQKDYAVNILKVKKVIEMQTMNFLQQTLAYFAGVIDLRGQHIPVINLRKKFNISYIGVTERYYVLIVDFASYSTQAVMGIMVDSIPKLVIIKSDDIDDQQGQIADHETTFVLGKAKVGERLTTLLDINQVLNQDELQQIRQILSTANTQ